MVISTAGRIVWLLDGYTEVSRLTPSPGGRGSGPGSMPTRNPNVPSGELKIPHPPGFFGPCVALMCRGIGRGWANLVSLVSGLRMSLDYVALTAHDSFPFSMIPSGLSRTCPAC